MAPAPIPYRASSVLLAYNPTTVHDPPKTLDELLTWIKAHPGKFTYNSPKSGRLGSGVRHHRPRQQVPRGRPGGDDDRLRQGRSRRTGTRAGRPWPGSTRTSSRRASTPTATTRSSSCSPAGRSTWRRCGPTSSSPGRPPAPSRRRCKVQQITDPSFTGGAAYVGVAKASKNQDLACEAGRTSCSRPTQQAKIADKIAGYPVIPIDKLPPRSRRSSAGPTPTTCARATSPTTRATSTTSGTRRFPGSDGLRHASGATAPWCPSPTGRRPAAEPTAPGRRLLLASPPLLLVALFVGFPIVVAIAYSLGPRRRPELDDRGHRQASSRRSTRGGSRRFGGLRRGVRRRALPAATSLVTVVVSLGRHRPRRRARLGDRALRAAVATRVVSRVLSALAVVPMFIPVVIASWAILTFYAADGFLRSVAAQCGRRRAGVRLHGRLPSSSA